MSRTPDKWNRVSRANPCPICGKPDWCLVAADGTAVLCPRIQSGAKRAVVQRQSGDFVGYLHDLGHAIPPRARPRPRPQAPRINAERIHEDCRRCLTDRTLSEYADRLGVPTAALIRLEAGYCERARAVTFPMRTDRYRVVGILLRNLDGRKWCIRGSRLGLFLPYLGDPDPLMICEGATDTAAMIGLGYAALGRPSCRGSVGYVLRLVYHLACREIVIVADRDRPGYAGAQALGRQLCRAVGRVRLIVPPDRTVKDVRGWIRNGATRADVDELIRNSPRMGTPTGRVSRERQPGTTPDRCGRVGRQRAAVSRPQERHTQAAGPEPTRSQVGT